MIVVIFEVTLKKVVGDRYFDIAGALRPKLEAIDGFISVERFESLVTDDKYVSLSFWRDMAAVDAWRAQPDHEIAQLTGKQKIFADFRITVAETVRQYSLADRV